MLPTGEDLDAFPTIRHVRSIAIDLLTRDDASLRNRILDAGERESSVRAEILRASERRQARVVGKGEVTVQLFAMPVVVDFGDQMIRSNREFDLIGRDSHMEGVVARIWHSAFDDPSLDIRPLPSMVHVNAALGISPSIVHAQVFRGASVYEGRQPETVQMCSGRKVVESGGGPVAPVYLMLAYVGSSDGASAPAAGTRPRDPRASAILGGVFAVEASVPAVRVLAPRRFYDALDDAHQAQLAHFMLWCGQHQCAHQIDLSPADEDTGEIQITGWYQRPGQSQVDEVNWTYDSTWRGRVDTKAVMDAAKVEAGVGQGQAPRRPQGERSDTGPLH